MRLLVLGGSAFVGRAVVDDALRRGWTVATFNRGRASFVDERVERLHGDRMRPEDLAVLTERTWDLVVDTWSGVPGAAHASAAALADRAGRYAYVSSCSVYAPPLLPGADEDAATVEPAPGGDIGDYAGCKRGAEIAITEAFGDRAVLARAGLILGPHEDVGRLPWWLLRMDRGGEAMAPGPADLALQYVDARDLAHWLLDVAAGELHGAFNVASRSGHATMGSLLDACRRVTGDAASLTWVEPGFVLGEGIEPWSQLPIWIPPGHEYRAMLEAGVERAHAAGLRCRPVEETVRDTWDWLLATGRKPPQRPDRDTPGLDAVTERDVLAAWHSRVI